MWPERICSIVNLSEAPSRATTKEPTLLCPGEHRGLKILLCPFHTEAMSLCSPLLQTHSAGAVSL
jgi:hypothetical protein